MRTECITDRIKETAKKVENKWLPFLALLAFACLPPGQSNFDVVLPEISQAAHQSQNKLGIVLLNDVNGAARQILNAGPGIVVALDPFLHQSIDEGVKEYKGKFTDAVTVLRLTTNLPSPYTVNQNPEQAARSFFEHYAAKKINRLGPSLAYYDYIEAPTAGQLPNWDNDKNVEWLSRFHLALARHYTNRGLRTCVSIEVGDVGGQSPEEIATRFSKFKALPEIVKLGGKICYHGYSLEGTMDIDNEIFTTFRTKILSGGAQKLGVSTKNLFILSETGWDHIGDKNSGFKARTSPENYVYWILWSNELVAKDPSIWRHAYFQIGDDGDWESFDLSPVAPQLADIIKKSR